MNYVTGKAGIVLPSVDPNKPASLMLANAKASAAAGYSLQDGIQDLVNQINPQTASDDFLALIGAFDNTNQLASVAASGQAALPGVLGTLIPFGTQLNYNSIVYKTLQQSTISTFNGSGVMTYAGGVVTVATNIAHSLSTGLSVLIAGCSQGNFNGTFTITVLSSTTFSYSITPGSYTSDSGTYSSVYALLNLMASTSGQNTNAAAGSALSVNVSGANSTAYAGVNGMGGGADAETNQAYLSRVMSAHSLTPGIATIPQEIWSAKKIAGNTRVFVIRGVNSNSGGGFGSMGQPGYIPNPGETCIYVVRDNDTSIQPSSAILLQTLNQLLADGLWPSNFPTSGLYVMAPNLQVVNFRITGVSAITMQQAIVNQLIQFWIENFIMPQGGGSSTISLITLNNFLTQIQDPTTGLFLGTGYTLVTPSSNINIPGGSIPISGTFTWS